MSTSDSLLLIQAQVHSSQQKKKRKNVSVVFAHTEIRVSAKQLYCVPTPQLTPMSLATIIFQTSPQDNNNNDYTQPE